MSELTNKPAEQDDLVTLFLYDAIAFGLIIVIAIYAPIPWWWKVGAFAWFFGNR